jgi:hypothetical protein
MRIVAAPLLATIAPLPAAHPCLVIAVTGCQSSDRPRSRVRVRARLWPSRRIVT